LVKLTIKRARIKKWRKKAIKIIYIRVRIVIIKWKKWLEIKIVWRILGRKVLRIKIKMAINRAYKQEI
jgi:hypothetical protein